MRIIVIFIILWLHTLVLPAQSGRERLSMDFGWRFSCTDTVDAVATGKRDDQWRRVDLPHDWSIEHDFTEDAPTTGRGGYLPTGIGWYRKTFNLPASAVSGSVWITFDGVYQNSDVWINEHHLGHYPNGYMSFSYDLTPYIHAGNNVVVVRVDNSRQPNTRWYSGSGIYRHVWLTIANHLHIKQWGTYVTTPKCDSAYAVVSVMTTLENKRKTAGNTLLRSFIIDPQGKQIAMNEAPVITDAGKETAVRQQIDVSKPSLWSLENPAMYTLRSQVIEGKKVVDEYNTPFGIRRIHYDTKGGFFLNDKHIKVNGVCLHHDAGSVGAAVPEAMWVRRLNVLKEMGCNAIRTSHNPVAPEFLDLCDRMGFLVMDEIFDEWTSAKVKYGYSVYFKEWAQHDLVNFIRRDRNHPSVVMWSAGNEIGEQKQDSGHEILIPLIETFHREDATRPVTTGNDNIAADGGSAKLQFLEALDIVGYNYVDRWHERRELFYDIDHHDHPDWKMVGTESVSIRGIRGNYFGGTFSRTDTTVIQPAYMPSVIRAEQLWKFVSIHDYVIGDFMWTGIDYLGEARWPSKNSSSGVIDLCGFPKDAYYFYQSQWTDKPMLHLFPHWNWAGHEGQVIPVMLYTNCDSVELFLNGKSIGMKALEFPRQGNSGGWNRYDRPQIGITTGDLHLTWDVPYEPGVLKAVGRKDGRVACEAEVRTTGKPAGLRLSVDRKQVSADARDVAHVRVEVVDERGNVVPTANNEIVLNVSGAGSLIGFDNGNPVDHTSMKSKTRRAFNGLALAVIQTNLTPGQVTVKAASPGLKEVSVEIEAVKAAHEKSVDDLKK